VHRSDGKLALTEREITCLFKQLFGAPIPENETLEDAAQACVFFVGVEYVAESLAHCKEVA
jgi:hypothetical protein